MGTQRPPRIEELAARDVVCAVEDVVAVPVRLDDSGNEPTADWRVTLADGRVADVEVTMHTEPAALSFWSQVTSRPGPERFDRRLSYVWTVKVSDLDPEANKSRPLRDLVDALVEVLVAAEGTGGTPVEIAEAANAELVSVHGYLKTSHWIRAWREAAPQVVSFEEWLRSWAPVSGYWYPDLLIDHFHDSMAARYVTVLKPPQRTGPGAGMIRIHGMTGSASLDNLEMLAQAIEERVEIKTTKGQMDGAPGLKWLAVMLDEATAWQLNDHFGPDAVAPYPFEAFGGVSFGCFDEVWVIGHAAHEPSYVVLRLVNPPNAPTQKVVPRSLAPPGGENNL